ncbi:addiction module protein [Gemmata sp. JC673]|uniref:Addiction module protein n=1 Tax=Gemmata algarum TaxID=2975278 RepID=A0ABU5EQX5_9BACT|nr:addiction module protein [Gemmata algarum]MDY3557752.1 addiction module protein [Gemmata algarum]
MSEAAEKLKPLLDALSAAERTEVAAYLRSLTGGHAEPDADDDEEPLTQDEWEAAWLPEIERRIADFESGKTQGVPADEFMRRMKEKYG